MREMTWVAFVVLSVWLMLVPAGGARAYYGDGETSSGNGLGATALDFTLRDADGAVTASLFDLSGIQPGPDWYVEPLEIRKETGLDFDYEAWFERTGDDEALCDELELKARQDSVLVYSGPLADFIYDAGVISGGQDDWSFEILFDNEDEGLENLSCEFDFVYRGEQVGGAGFYDEERVSNVFATGEWGAELGDVVINEVMWMGSTVSSTHDEWIELRNMTNQEIDIAQWTVDNGRAGGNSLVMTPSSKVIPANGYLIIADSPETSANSALNVPVDVVNASLSLANEDNGNLVLRDRYGNVVDEAKGDAWPEGDNGDPEKKSMERNDTPGDGTLASSWHTCEDDDGVGSDCNDGTFWDTDDGDDYGTPGAANLSEGDPTSPDGLYGAGPMSGDGEGEEPASEGEGSVNVAVEPTGTGEGQEGNAGDGGSDANSGVMGSVDENNGDTGSDDSDGDNEVIWLGNEDNGVADIGGAGEGDADGDGNDSGGEASGDGSAAPDNSVGQGDESNE